MKAIHFLFTGLAGIMSVVIYVALFGAHIWTTYMAYKIAGPLAGLITFIAPPLAEIYWAAVAWMETGVFLNAFVTTYLMVAALFVVQIVLAMLMAASEPRN